MPGACVGLARTFSGSGQCQFRFSNGEAGVQHNGETAHGSCFSRKVSCKWNARDVKLCGVAMHNACGGDRGSSMRSCNEKLRAVDCASVGAAKREI